MDGRHKRLPFSLEDFLVFSYSREGVLPCVIAAPPTPITLCQPLSASQDCDGFLLV